MRRTVLACLAATWLAFPAAAADGREPEPLRLMFLADPQVHNVHGAALKQMYPFADWVSKVAIRPPEVNLLAPLVLREALELDRALPEETRDLVVVLGDGTNIGCSGEADLFDHEFKRSGRLRLMAHGNHDSYLMGTVNAYGPWGTNTRTLAPAGDFPVDEAFWDATGSPQVTGTSGFGRNWLDACYKPADGEFQAGTPMNKLRWVARYLDSLRPHGLVLRSDGQERYEGRAFSATGQPGTRLGELGYRALGVWYAAYPATATHGADYARAWNSFLVQAIDVGTQHTLILIDTSVCQNARGGVAFAWSNAGQHSCIGERQFAALRQLLDGLAPERRPVFAGHFPLGDIRWRDRRRLRKLMAQASPAGWTYVSAHTHGAFSPRHYADGSDWNIGSTTDWPMESHVLHFDAEARYAGHAAHRLAEHHAPVDYRPGSSVPGTYSELCRHLDVAQQLAGADPAAAGGAWTSAAVDAARCQALQADWRGQAEALGEAQARISARFDEEPDYRDFVLRVAAGASRYEAGQRAFGPRRIP